MVLLIFKLPVVYPYLLHVVHRIYDGNINNSHNLYLAGADFLVVFASKLSGHGASSTSLRTSNNLLLSLLQLCLPSRFYLDINFSHRSLSLSVEFNEPFAAW